MALLVSQVDEQTDLVTAEIPKLGVLNVIYHPARITEELVRSVQGTGRAALIVPVIADWDFYISPPVVENGEVVDPGVKMPIDEASLNRLGLPNAMIVVAAIIDRELGKVGKATGRGPANGSKK